MVQHGLIKLVEEVDPTETINDGTHQLLLKSEEEFHYCGFTKTTRRKMAAMHIPGVVGNGAIAKAFGLSGDSGKNSSMCRQEISTRTE